MQLVTDIEPYILWNNIVPINPLKDFDRIFNQFTNQIYPDILRSLQDGYKYFDATKAQVLHNLGLYGNYELITIQEQDFPNFLQLFALLTLNNPNYRLLTPTNIYAPFQGIYRAMFKAGIAKTQNSNKQDNLNTKNSNTKTNRTNKEILTPNIAILPVYSYLSGIPIRESEILRGVPATRIYDLSQVFYNLVIYGIDSLSYTSTPNIFIVSARALHIPLDTIFIFIKKTKEHQKLLNYLINKDNISTFDTAINNISWVNTWQQDQSSLLSTVTLHKFLINTSKDTLKKALIGRVKLLDQLYTNLAEILGTNKKKYLLPPDKSYYNTTLKLPIYMAQKIYKELTQNYVLVDYVEKTHKTAYLVFTPGLELSHNHLRETLELLNKII